jgi:inositol oxygenase
MAFYNEPQWAVVGDTFPVGCAPQDSIVYGKASFKNNPDIQNDKYRFVILKKIDSCIDFKTL